MMLHYFRKIFTLDDGANQTATEFNVVNNKITDNNLKIFKV